MQTVSSKKAAHKTVQCGKDCILVLETYRERSPIVGGYSAVYWFANYTSKHGKIGYTSQNIATQIHV